MKGEIFSSRLEDGRPRRLEAAVLGMILICHVDLIGYVGISNPDEALNQL